MNSIPGKCPVCNNALTVTRLQCGQCGTGIDGQFHLGSFQALNPEQLQFVETFIKCRGKIKDVEDALGISYPTVVAKLNGVVQALGYEVDEKDLSEVDQFEMYQAQVLSPRHHVPAPHHPIPPIPPVPPVPPTPPTPPFAPRLSEESRQQVLADLAEGKISAAEAMKKLHG
jgi:hypothetical protein